MKRKQFQSLCGNRNFRYRLGLIVGAVCLAGVVHAQELEIHGKVTDRKGEPIRGVTVSIKGAPNSVMSTSNKGTYELNKLKKDQVLIFTSVGYKSVEIPYQGQKELDVQLEDDLANLDEVVVVGFGTKKKQNLTGAVDQISGKVLESRPISNVMQGLQGVSPGLNITYGNGTPGGIPNINIRGTTSINGGSPLFVIDGIPATDANDLIRLNPTDIESYTVLRDAASSAIYGARATYGVILITTKSGKLGKQSVSFNTNSAWGKPTEMPDPVTDPYIFSKLLELSTNNTPWDYVNYSDEHYQWAKERSDNPSLEDVRIDPKDPKRWAYMGNNNWNKYFLNNSAHSQSYNLTFSGGAKVNELPFKYYLSGDYTKENGLSKLAADYWTRKGLRGRVNIAPFKWLQLDNNTNLYNTHRESPAASLTDIYYLTPIQVAKNPDGTWANTDAGRLAARLSDGGKSNGDMFGFQNTFNATGTFLNGDLKISGDASVKREYYKGNGYAKKFKIGFGPDDIREEGGTGYVNETRGDMKNTVFNLYANYNKTIGKHNFGAMVGYNQEEYIYSSTYVNRNNLISSTLPYLGLTTGEMTLNAGYSSYATRSYFGRLNYTFNERYILEGTGRYDGSSRFPKASRWGFFPSVSGAWIVSNESFFESLKPKVSNLKLRTSYGSLGNQNVGDFSYIQTMGTSLSGYLINGNQQYVVNGAPPLTIDPNSYTWENVSTLNFGADLGLFNDKFFVSYDNYIRNTTGMLTAGLELPGVLGTSVPRQNAADLRTKGWELSVTYKDQFELANKPFSFDAKVVLSDSRAKITKFKNDERLLSTYFNGYEFGTIYGLQGDGLFKSADEIKALDESGIVPWGALNIVNGWPKFKDIDGNGKIERGLTETNLKDLQVIGNSADRYRIGFNLNMNWGGFDASVFLQGVLKRDFYPRHYLFWGPYQQPYANIYPWHLDFYRETSDTPEERAKHSQAYLNAGLADANHDARYPVLQSWLADVNDGKGLAIPNTQYMLNGSYLRLKNITFGYTLPHELLEKWKIQRLRVFFSGENLFEFSQIKKYVDPEAINNGTDGSAWAYPFQRKFSVGLNLDF